MDRATADASDRVWRTSAVARLASWSVVAVGVAGAVAGAVVVAAGAVTLNMEAFTAGLLGTGLGGFAALAAWRYGIHPLIGATAAGVLVRNPLQSVLIQWGDVDACSPGYSGVEIERRDGSLVVAWAVQKANMSRWLGRAVRADEVVAYIEARASGDRSLD